MILEDVWLDQKKHAHENSRLTFIDTVDNIREGFTKKVAVILDFVQRRGEGPAQFVCHLFISAFLVNNRSLQNANNLNFKLFFRLLTWPKIFASVYLDMDSGYLSGFGQIIILSCSTYTDNDSYYWYSLQLLWGENWRLHSLLPDAHCALHRQVKMLKWQSSNVALENGMMTIEQSNNLTSEIIKIFRWQHSKFCWWQVYQQQT